MANKTRFTESAARGQTLVTETGPLREKLITGRGRKADFGMIEAGGVSDLSASITGGGKVKRR